MHRVSEDRSRSSTSVEEATLKLISRALDEHGYRTHEFGDSVFVEAARETSTL
jgi:hypothetical protein